MAPSPKRHSKSPSKAKSKSADPCNVSKSIPTTPFSDVSNITNKVPPPKTPRVVDFALSLPEAETGGDEDGWSSDDSFEKITWSRYRVRTIPGTCTPRNIQDVRRRLNLEELPEDKNPSHTVIRPIPIKHRKQSSRPSTPVKTFLAKDPSVLPPTPSPKKTAPSGAARPSTPAGSRSVVKTPGKPAKEVSKPMILATQSGGAAGAATIARPASPFRQPITHVKEFHFASNARTRRKTDNKSDNPQPEGNSHTHGVDVAAVTDAERMEGVEMVLAVDEGLTMRMKAHEIGKASILAWGETRGRYTDD